MVQCIHLSPLEQHASKVNLQVGVGTSMLPHCSLQAMDACSRFNQDDCTPNGGWCRTCVSAASPLYRRSCAY